MYQNGKKISADGVLVLWLVILNTIILKQGFIAHPKWYFLLMLTIPLMLISLFVFRRKIG